MKRIEYMHLKLSDPPKDFINQYKLASKNTKDGYVYIKFCKVVYRLSQAVILAQKLL